MFEAMLAFSAWIRSLGLTHSRPSKQTSLHNTTQHNTTPQLMATVDDYRPAQGLIVLSCGHNTTNNQLIQNIWRRFCQKSEEQDLEECEPKCFDTNEDIDCYDLKIDNKYYSANISLFDLKDNNSVDNAFKDSVNGIVIYFDGNQESSFTSVQSCLPFVSQFNNEIKLLICESIDENNLKLQSIQKWCIDNEFELIELSPVEETDGSEEPFEELNGMDRLIQAIQAHSWPHSQLKERPNYKPSPKFKEMIDNEVFNSINEVKDIQQNVLSDEKTEDDENDYEFENFDHLFSKFNELKVKASQLNDTERKRFAEKVTLAFWRTVGEDPNEIEGIDDYNYDLNKSDSN